MLEQMTATFLLLYNNAKKYHHTSHTCIFRLTNENQIKLLIRVIVNIWQIHAPCATHPQKVRNSAKYFDR